MTRLAYARTLLIPFKGFPGFLARLALSLWVGAMFFFSLAVAPVAFSVLPDHQLAGEVVASCLRVLYFGGYVLGALLLISWLPVSAQMRWFRTKVAILVLMLGLNLAGDRWILPRMDALRMQLGGTLEGVSPTNPLARQFTQLHHVSEDTFGLMMLGGLVLVGLG